MMTSFAALSDPNRRRIVEMVARRGSLTAGEIGEKFSISPPAISQHLKVLRQARVLNMQPRAQQRIYSINQDGLGEMEKWVTELRQLWEARFDALDQLLKKEMNKSRKRSRKKAR